MQRISCPYCGERGGEEFVWGGPSDVSLSQSGEVTTDGLTDAEWADYLYNRDNIKGVSAERWCHVRGCGQWFNLVRSSVTHEIEASYGIGEGPSGGIGSNHP